MNYKKKKCGFCRKEGHLFSECIDSKIDNISKLFNNEMNENIIDNFDVYIIIICYMYESFHNINHKYLYYNPIINFIKNKIEKIIIKKNIIEKKVISRINNLPTSFNKYYLNNQLIDKYFLNFIKEFKKKELILDILNNENDDLLININIFIKNNFYTKIDITLFILFSIKLNKIEADNIICYLYEINNEINNNNLLLGIQNGIKKLIEYGYGDNFKKESVHHIKNIITYNNLILSEINLEKNDFCPICYDELKIENLIITNCSHNYCKSCFNILIDKRLPYINPICSLCRSDIISIKSL